MRLANNIKKVWMKHSPARLMNNLHSSHCFIGLVYSAPLSDDVTLDDATDVKSLSIPFPKLLESSSGILRGSGAAGRCPSSASFLRRFITVGRNFVERESIPGSCTHTYNKQWIRGKKIYPHGNFSASRQMWFDLKCHSQRHCGIRLRYLAGPRELFPGGRR